VIALATIGTTNSEAHFDWSDSCRHNAASALTRIGALRHLSFGDDLLAINRVSRAIDSGIDATEGTSFAIDGCSAHS
jgi:hypothetical protein